MIEQEILDAARVVVKLGDDQHPGLASWNELWHQAVTKLKATLNRWPAPVGPNPNAYVWCDDYHQHTAKCTTCRLCGGSHDGQCEPGVCPKRGPYKQAHVILPGATACVECGAQAK